MNRFLIPLVVVLFLAQSLHGQNTEGRWTIGVRGGGNVWFNDLSDVKVGPGGELEIGYEFPNLSLWAY